MQQHTRLRFIRFGARLAWGTAGVVGVLVAVRLVWGWEASARLRDAEAAVARQQFELDPRKLLPAPLPDDQNAAVALLETFGREQIEMPDPSRRGEGRFPGFGRMFGMMNGRRVMDQLEKNGEALRTLDRAAALPKSEWEVNADGSLRPLENERINSALFGTQMLLRNGAGICHMNGEDERAIGMLEKLLTVARVAQSRQSLSTKQVACTMTSDAALSAERWEPELELTPAVMAGMRRLAGELMESADRPMGMRRAFEYETATYSEEVMAQSPALNGWWIRPLAVDSFARRLMLQSRMVPMVEAKDWPTAAAMPVERETYQTNLGKMVTTVSTPRLLAAEAMRAHFHAMSDARGAATLLAARVYRKEKGKYPESLSELVPAYLAEVPVDPFAGDGRALRYRVDPRGPTVWSVGENGKDDGGEVSLAGFPMYGNARRYAQPDMVYGAAWRAAAATLPWRGGGGS
ncbi:MAG: hypothetical protein ACTHN5_09420 [Phycisphaerae bacterium]